MISTVFSQVLRSGRDHFNAQFAEARRAQPTLDGALLNQFLVEAVDPVVVAAEQRVPGSASSVAMAAYEVALELVASRMVGTGTRHDLILSAWREVLVASASLVAVDPRRIMAAATNAVNQLATTPGAKTRVWIDEMSRLGPKCDNVETWLRLGQILAWRGGLAHLRAGALASADALPESLALSAVAAHALRDWPEVRANLQKNPWFDPAKTADDSRLRVVARVGGFRGFGGGFRTLPRATTAGDHLVVGNAGDAWALTADVFGATFHRALPQEQEALAAEAPPVADVTLAGTRITAKGQTLDLPEFGELTSVARQGNTLAVTAKLTYAIILLALPDK